MKKIECKSRFKIYESPRGIAFFDYKVKGSLKRFVDVMFSIKELKRKVLVLSVKVLLPCSNKWVNASLFMDRRFGLTVPTFSTWELTVPIFSTWELTVPTFSTWDSLSFFKSEQWRWCLINSIALNQIAFSKSRK